MATATPLFPALLDSPRPAEWDALRQAAETALAGLTLPTTREESWKYTDLRDLDAQVLAVPAPATVDLQAHILPEARGSRMVFVNGHFDAHHSSLGSLPPGVRVLRLSQASELASSLGRLAAGDPRDPFAQLNNARFQDGVLVVVPKGLQVEPVLHVVFAQSGTEGMPAVLPRLLVVVERGASAHLVEEYLGEGTYLTSAITEVVVHENAELRHERIQRESPEAWHFHHLEARVEQGARYDSRSITFGARLSRQTPHVVLAAPGADATLDALALISGSQVADTHSLIDHATPHGTSRQLHKAIADGQGRAVFNGRIIVREGAQLTNAQQQSRNLLLSDKGRVDAKPELEIFADDVKCSHGATVGQLDPEELFYLRSRGLNPDEARNLLTYGFAAEIIAGIEVPTLRRALRQAVLQRTQGREA